MYCDLWWQCIKVRKLFKGGNYSKGETIRGNTVNIFFFVLCNLKVTFAYLMMCINLVWSELLQSKAFWVKTTSKSKTKKKFKNHPILNLKWPLKFVQNRPKYQPKIHQKIVIKAIFKVRWRFHKILWPSQKVCTLTGYFWENINQLVLFHSRFIFQLKSNKINT